MVDREKQPLASSACLAPTAQLGVLLLNSNNLNGHQHQTRPLSDQDGLRQNQEHSIIVWKTDKYISSKMTVPTFWLIWLTAASLPIIILALFFLLSLIELRHSITELLPLSHSIQSRAKFHFFGPSPESANTIPNFAICLFQYLVTMRSHSYHGIHSALLQWVNKPHFIQIHVLSWWSLTEGIDIVNIDVLFHDRENKMLILL